MTLSTGPPLWQDRWVSEGRRSWGPSVQRAALVFAGCFLGTLASKAIRFPQLGTAILFLPYAVLTALLLVEQPRRYWLLLLASAAGNFVPHLQTGPASFALLTELANFTRALLVVFVVRRFGSPGAHLSSLRGLAVFLIAAAALGPAAGAAIGAGLVVAFRDADYWLAFRAWFFSNAVTGITLLPALWMLVTRPRFSLPSSKRLLEAGVLSVGLAAVGAWVLGWSASGRVLPASIYLLMPFLLWAAVRFGAGGISLALTCVTLLTIFGAIQGHGPFAGGSPMEDLLELQLFVLVFAVPLLLLSALIAEHRRTAAELRSSRAQYQSVVEDQTEMICRFRPDGKHTFLNGAFRRHFGLPPHDLGQRSAFEFVAQGSLAAITPEHSVVVRETEALDSEGNPSWQQWRDRGLFDTQDQLVEYQSVGRDITPDKLAERRERELLAQREVAVALREMDRHKDEFLAMLGHELRNPLAPISSALDLLSSALGIDPVARAHQVIARQLGHLKRLVDDLVDVSRITHGDIRVERTLIDARDVVDHALETVRPLIENRGHELRVSLPDQAVPIDGDRERLAQVLVNLLSNAAKYTEPGGQLALSLRVESGSVLFRVDDNGIGIPEGYLERVFELFERGAAGPNRPIDGLGIGLTLARRLVELNDGSLTASSLGPGHGSTFLVRLPLSQARRSIPSRIQLSPKAVATMPLRILLVDDNVDAAETLAEVLSNWGHRVHAVHTGTEALAFAREQRPDVVLSDLGLPDLGGLELARALRRDPHAELQLLVAITGFGKTRDRANSIEAGFDHHLVKPIDSAELARLLSSVVLRRAADDARGPELRTAAERG